jgi:hypothetical protein
LATALTGIVLTGAFLRAKLKPLVVGGAVAAVPCAAGLVTLALVAPATAESLRAALWPGPPIRSSTLTALLLGLPILIGLLAGILARERLSVTVAGLTVVLLLPLLEVKGYGEVLGGAAIGALLYGLIARLAAWYWEGNRIDAVCGALVGSVFGGFLGFLLLGVLVRLIGTPEKMNDAWYTVGVMVVMGGGVLLGAGLMSARATVAGRKARTPRSLSSAPARGA